MDKYKRGEFELETNITGFKKGLRDGFPIFLGYLAVSFTLGIAASSAGLTASQATLMSITNNTSAGEFAALGLISSGASYLEMAITQFIINMRYLLMSCSLSQKLDANTTFIHRLLISFYVTDEIFGVSISANGKLNPFYTYGVIAFAAPGWALGTCLGIVTGNILPARILSALGIALYGMFIAVIIPPAKENKILLGLVTVSMAISFLFTKFPHLNHVSSGFKIIILTVVIAGIAAVLLPVKEETEEIHEA